MQTSSLASRIDIDDDNSPRISPTKNKPLSFQLRVAMESDKVEIESRRR
jgi:hypothetical protein